MAAAKSDFTKALADIRQDVLNIKNVPPVSSSDAVTEGPAFDEKVKTAVNAQLDAKLKEPATITYIGQAFRAAKVSPTKASPPQPDDPTAEPEKHPELPVSAFPASVSLTHSYPFQ